MGGTAVLTRAQTVDIGHSRGRLAPAAAESLARIDAEAGRPLDVNSAWRDPVLQDRMYAAWLAWINGTGTQPNHGRALPSWQSIHCRGMAIDTDDWQQLKKLLNAHGWFQVADDEPWHFEYDPTRDTRKDDDMFTDKDRERLNHLHGLYRKGVAGKHHEGEAYAKLRVTLNNTRTLLARQAAGDAALKTLADLVAAGAGMDADAILATIEKAAQEGVREALANFELTLTAADDDDTDQ